MVVKNDEKQRLYRVLNNTICARIFNGDYKDGENLPPERALAKSLDVSRVTVRKALALLEDDGIIERVQGSGNRIRLAQAGYHGSMDVIAVVAQAQNAFFSAFIDHFQRTAEANDSLVLFKQTLPGQSLEDGLFRLFQKNIRNAVIWLEGHTIDFERIRRLRGLGMNMTFFDALAPRSYADSVLLDNAHAMATLFGALTKRGLRRIAYVGWDNARISSVLERENAALAQVPEPSFVHRMAWLERDRLSRAADALVDCFGHALQRPDGIVCGDGEIGVAVRKTLLSRGLAPIAVASPDEFPESRELSITFYRQDFQKMAETTFHCLGRQNREGWEAADHRIRGELVDDRQAPAA